jgi:hypothetical protein
MKFVSDSRQVGGFRRVLRTELLIRKELIASLIFNLTELLIRKELIANLIFKSMR